MTTAAADEFLLACAVAINDATFVKLALGAYAGSDETLKKIEIRPVIIKRRPHLSFTYRHKTRDIVKNHEPDAAVALLTELIPAQFPVATLFTTQFDLALEAQTGRKQSLRKKSPTSKAPPDASHDRSKNRPLSAQGQHYLHALKITDDKGDVLKAAQDKYRQINKYIEILGGLLKDVTAPLRIVDMGAGKGYLTFALYDALKERGNVHVTGVEYRADLVDLCNRIAEESGFGGLRFVEGSIATYDSSDANVLIALHACDTATDDAIHKGIAAQADLIVVAPCCHKQIRREMTAGKPDAGLDSLLRHGTFMERQAEMVTDALRALLLEHAGYSVKVFEFISDTHTPKNVMIVATRTGKANAKALEKFRAAKAFYGVGTHHLEELLKV